MTSFPTTSSELGKNASIRNKDRSTGQKIIGQTNTDSDTFLPAFKIKEELPDSDASPPRRQMNCTRRNHNNVEDHSFSKRKKSTNDLDLDVSPPRRRIKNEPVDSDPSPPRRSTNCARRNSNDDVSDVSPPRRRKPTNNSDSDLSPPRKRDDYAGIQDHGKEFGSYGHQKRRRSGSVDSGRRSWDSDASSHDKIVRKRQKNYGRSRDGSPSRRHRRYEGKY